MGGESVRSCSFRLAVTLSVLPATVWTVAVVSTTSSSGASFQQREHVDNDDWREPRCHKPVWHPPCVTTGIIPSCSRLPSHSTAGRGTHS